MIELIGSSFPYRTRVMKVQIYLLNFTRAFQIQNCFDGVLFSFTQTFLRGVISNAVKYHRYISHWLLQNLCDFADQLFD